MSERQAAPVGAKAPVDEPRVILTGLSDPGKARETQEDAWLVYNPPTGPERRRIGRVFAVADGIGGSRAGEVASQLTVEAIRDGCLQTPGPARRRLRAAVQEANRRVIDAAADRPECRGMGSTVVAGVIQADRLTVAWLGDSRAYLLRERTLTQITRDHCGSGLPGLAAQGAGLSRWVGMGMSVEPAIREIILHPGDQVLICTDGLHGLVTNDAMARAAGGGAERWAAELVRLALRQGAPDNVTVVCAQVDRLPFAPHRHAELRAGSTIDGIELNGLTGEDQFYLWFRARAHGGSRLVCILRPELQSDTELLLETEEGEESLARVANDAIAIVEGQEVEKSLAYVCLAPPWDVREPAELHSLEDALSHGGGAAGMADPRDALRIAECVAGALSAVRDSLSPAGAPHPSDFWGDGSRYALFRWPSPRRRYSVSTSRGMQPDPLLREYLPPDFGPNDAPCAATDAYFVGCILDRLLGEHRDGPVASDLLQRLLAGYGSARPAALAAVREAMATFKKLPQGAQPAGAALRSIDRSGKA